jgi:hypothetical protein
MKIKGSKGGGIAGAVSNPVGATTSLGQQAADDPARVGRGVATMGASEAYKASTDPSKRDAKKAQEAQDAASGMAVTSQEGVAKQMAQHGAGYMDRMNAETNDFKRIRNENSARADIADQEYADTLSGSEKDYQTKVKGLQSQAETQAADAKSTYTNTILPGFKNSMEDAQRQASQAMSLSDAGDMNNSVQKGVRDFYGQQAKGEGQQGLADVGVLSAMGAQALGNQMGQGGPMTGAQLQLATSQNMAQSGQAFANTQKRIQALKQQGIEQGLTQSNQQYNRGQDAREFAQKSVGAYEGANNRMNNEQADFRGEIGTQQNNIRSSQYAGGNAVYGGKMSQINRGIGNAAQDYGLNTGLAGQQYGINQGNALQNQQVGMMKAGIASDKAYNQALQASADRNAQNAMWSGGIQAAATAGGAAMGGAQGAQAGSAVGGVGGQAAGMGQQAPPQQQQTGFNWQGANQGSQTAGNVMAPISQAMMAQNGAQPQRPRQYGSYGG